MSHGNVIYDILDPNAFKKYSTWWVFQALLICVFVCVFVILFVISQRQWIVGVMSFQKIYDLICLTWWWNDLYWISIGWNFWLVQTYGRTGIIGTLRSPRGPKKIHVHKNEHVHVTFVNLIIRNFALNDDIKSLFLHCGDELNGLGPSWMVLTHGNVIYLTYLNPKLLKDMLGLSSIFLFNFFYMYFTTRPRASLTAVTTHLTKIYKNSP